MASTKKLALNLLFFIFLFFGLTFLSKGPTVYAATEPADPEQIPVKVMLIIYDPILESRGGLRLHEFYEMAGWEDPVVLANELVAVLNSKSNNKVNYQIVKTDIRDEWPIYTDDSRYDDDSYLADYGSWDDHDDVYANYNALIDDNLLGTGVIYGDVDEVWLFGGPGFGFTGSATVGEDAYATNATIYVPGNMRLYSMLGFYYDRDVVVAMDTYGHVIEGVMRRMYDYWSFPYMGGIPPPAQAPAFYHSWDAFTVKNYDPGDLIGCGVAHGFMNSPTYGAANDWGLTTPTVASICDDFIYNYPYLTGEASAIDCYAWGCNGDNDGYKFLGWWFEHMPHMAGTYDGYLNNWWRYLTNLDTYKNIRQLTPNSVTTDFAENNAASWICDAADNPPFYYTCSLSNETDRTISGSSVKMTTDGALDVYMKYPAGGSANWNLTKNGTLSFWVYATNFNTPGFFQDNITVYLKNSAGNGYKYEASSGLLDGTLEVWKKFDIPLAGDAVWVRTNVGTPNLADIDYVEIHADSSAAGYTLILDGLGFVTDFAQTTTDWACTGGTCSFSQVTGLSKEGASGVELSTDSSGDATATYPSAGNANWDLTNKSIVFWAHSDNPNSGKFEAGSPVVDIRTTNSSNYYRFTPTSNLLNGAINRWQRYEIPVNGNSLWTRSTVGSPSLANIDQIVIHSDTTGTSPYHVIYDGLRFESRDVTNPTVDIPWPPAPGPHTVPFEIPIRVFATDNTAIKRVDLLMDGEFFQTDAIAPYFFDWDPALFTEGEHTLIAKAYDLAGNVATTPTLTLNAQPGRIIADSFESGDTTGWSSETDTEGDLNVESNGQIHDLWNLRATIDNTTAMYLTNTSPIIDTRYRARFLLNANYFSAPTGANLTLLLGRTTVSTFGVQLYHDATTHVSSVRTYIYNDAGTITYGSLIPLSINFHSIEIDWMAATATGANDGYISLWVDGIAQGSQTGIDNDTKRVDEVRFGAVSGILSGSSGSFVLDSFVSSREDYIGPVDDTVFDDGFDSGDVSAWSSETDTENDLGVAQGAAALDGPWGLSALIDNPTFMYVSDVSPNRESIYHARFIFDPNSVAIGDDSYVTIFRGINDVGAGLFDVQLNYFAETGYQIRPSVGGQNEEWFSITDGPHDLELEWHAASSIPPWDGYFFLSVDGVVHPIHMVSSYLSKLEEVRLGAVDFVDGQFAEVSGTVYFDKFTSRNSLGRSLLLADGLESGDTSAWSSETDAENDLTVTTGAKIQGAYGLSALIDNTTDMYLTDDVPEDETTYHTRLYLDPNTLTMASGDTFSVLQGSASSSSAFQVQLNYSGGYKIRTQIYTDAGVESNGSWVSISDGPHSIEIDWKASTAFGANDGYISLWVDNVAFGSQSDIDNDTKRVDDVRIGIVNGADAGTSGTIYLDTFESREDSYIDVPTLVDFLFVDALESGSTSSWSSETDAENDLTVTTGSKIHGTYGLSALIDNTTAMYVTDTSPLNTTRYRSRFYFDPNSLTMTGGDRFNLFTGRTTTSSFDVILYRNSTSGYNIRTQIYNDAATEIDGTYVPISDAPHAIEIDWQAASAPGANDGSIALWVDGILQGVQGAIDNDTKRVDEVRFGAVGGVDAGTSGTFYLDTFESRNTSYIGILEPVSDTILSDGFESGNASLWSSETDTENDMSVTTGSKLDGNYGLSALIDNTTDMYVSAFTSSKNRYRARFYFDPNSITMADNDRFSLLVGRVSNSSFQVQLKYSTSSGYNIRTSVHNDALVETYGTYVPITDAPHAIEVDWEAASAVGANDGSISLWVDGVFKGTQTGIDNDTKRVEEVRLGAATGLDAGTSGTIYLDKFESRRSTYIGL